MAVASRFLSTDNGIGSYYPSDVGVPEGSVGQVVNTVDEMVREVRFQVKNGVDLVKIGDSVYGQHEAFSCDEMKAIVDTAHRLNTKVTIHARGSNNVRSAVRAGVDWIQHANVMTDDVIDELAESRIPVAPVLVLLANLLDFGSIVGVPVWKRDVYRRLLDQASETYNKARKAGVVFMTGTDSGFAATPSGEWHAREIELLMTYAGLSALDAIAAATKNAAVTLCGKHDVGSIEVGKAADVIVVDGDPLRDIRVLQDRRNIAVVVAAGVIQHFDDDVLATRHPYDRAQHIAPGEITWDVVFGSGDASGLDLANLNQDIAMDMVRDLRAAGKAAAGQAED
jgi:imidazolonepropionase-like amidohydrolase